jgi:hypothetical protein
LIDKISIEAGLDTVRAEKSVAALLTLVTTQGGKAQVAMLMEKLPGAADLLAQHGEGGGLMGKLAGGMMGGPLAMVTKLQALGLTPAQMGQVGTLTLNYAKSKAGVDIVRAAAANIPGLSGYL